VKDNQQIAAMKTKLITCGCLSLAAFLLQGCVGLPSLVKVEHKNSPDTEAIVKRLDAIDHRLAQLEHQREKAENKEHTDQK